MENQRFLKEQIITYIGNKRKLLSNIGKEIEECLQTMGKDKCSCLDLFSGSGIVARYMKQYSTDLYANDLEEYSYVINSCYLSNEDEFEKINFLEKIEKLKSFPNVENGVISQNYAPRETDNIKEGERCFYTHENAVRIDTWRTAIDKLIPEEEQKYFLAPLLYEASVHANTSGVFKGFYKSKQSNVGKFGGEGENATQRIKGPIELGKKPVFSLHNCNIHLYKEDANELVKKLPHIDIAYLDPPYNQHPYGSNYFMLNVILKNYIDGNISRVSGIPEDWNKSAYNKKKECLSAMDSLIRNLDASYIIISYNNEGFITYDEMMNLLSKYGTVKSTGIDYTVFRGGRITNRNKDVTEYLFTLKKN